MSDSTSTDTTAASGECAPQGGGGGAAVTSAAPAKKPAPRSAAKVDDSIDPTYTIEKWRCVMEWKFTDDSLQDCQICKNSLKDSSIDYLSDPSAANDAAGGLELQHGACGHVYHRDCISRWLKTRNQCPVCQAHWNWTKNEPIQGADAIRQRK